MFQAILDPVVGSLGLSALVACIPLVTFFVMLMGFKTKAHTAAAVALAAAIIVASIAFQMPLGLALVSATQGAAYGAFPIVFIILSAVWLYDMTVKSGRADDLRAFFDEVGSGDIRVQATMIAFCFGGLLEAVAGFGSPVAITATMLVTLGVKPKKAALAALIANTAPVAYCSAGLPITTAASMVSGGDAALTSEIAQHVGAIVGTQAPICGFIVPFLILIILDGKKGLKDCWLPALVMGLSFGLTQYWCSNHFVFELTDIIATLVSLGCIVLFMRFWKPKGVNEVRERFGLEAYDPDAPSKLNNDRIFMALLPYFMLAIVIAFCKIVIPDILAPTTIKIPWPIISGGTLANYAGADPGTTFNFNFLTTPGTMILVSCLISAAIYSLHTENGKYKMTMGSAVKQLGTSAVNMRFSALTIVLVLALAYVMNFSGQTMSIGYFLSGSGNAFAFISPVIGWVGTAVTGSDTSANALFAGLQYMAATSNPALTNVTPDLFLAANTMGGVMGKMISPQSLAIAALVTHVHESEIMKSILPWSIAMLLGLCVLVFLQSSVLYLLVP